MSSEFIHNPDGIILFHEPTTLQVSTGCVESTTTATVLPFSNLRENSVWAGQDTYHIPDDAEFTIIENLDMIDPTNAATESDGETIDLAELLNSHESN